MALHSKPCHLQQLYNIPYSLHVKCSSLMVYATRNCFDQYWLEIVPKATLMYKHRACLYIRCEVEVSSSQSTRLNHWRDAHKQNPLFDITVHVTQNLITRQLPRDTQHKARCQGLQHMLGSLTFHVGGTSHETCQLGAGQVCSYHAVGVSAEGTHH